MVLDPFACPSISTLTPTSITVPTARIKYNSKKLKRCPKCCERKELSKFDKHATSGDGYQSYCKACKSNMHKRKRSKNASFRLKHHFATRMKDQLGDLCPKDLSKRLETLLGYKMSALIKHLTQELQEREGKAILIALNEGYHVDHIRPLSNFTVINKTQTGTEINWNEFKCCWAIKNLVLISAAENLAKGAKYSAPVINSGRS